jgi:hypothetical protein
MKKKGKKKEKIPRSFLVRASFANKENSTPRGWGLGA